MNFLSVGVSYKILTLPPWWSLDPWDPLSFRGGSKLDPLVWVGNLQGLMVATNEGNTYGCHVFLRQPLAKWPCFFCSLL